MRKVLPFVAATLGLVVLTVGVYRAADNKKPKYTIKEVMEAHGEDELRAKVLAGKAEKKDKEKLLELYTALGQNKPPRGPAASWKKKTGAIVAAAKEVVADEDGAVKKLEKATACAACHSVHKPKKEE